MGLYWKTERLDGGTKVVKTLCCDMCGAHCPTDKDYKTHNRLHATTSDIGHDPEWMKLKPNGQPKAPATQQERDM